MKNENRISMLRTAINAVIMSIAFIGSVALLLWWISVTWV